MVCEICQRHMETVLQAPTVMLIQPGRNPHWRTYLAFESLRECLLVILEMYHDCQRQLHPNARVIACGFRQLFDFIDGLEEIVCLVYQRETNSFVQCNKNWIKEKIYLLLERPQQLNRHV